MVPEADHGAEEAIAGTDLGRPDRPLVRQADQAARSKAPRVLVVGCGALARELVELTRPLPNVDIACLPAELHNRPGGIPARVRARIRKGRREGYEQIFVAYADCGTGGLLEPVLAEEGVERLPGAHCYEFFAGRTDFARLSEEEPGTFYLTDFLARNFERLIIRGLGIDKHPELAPMYFGNYRRVVYLSQTDDPDLLAMAQRAAERLGLAFEHLHTGYGELADSILALGAPNPLAVAHPVNTSNRSAGKSATAVHPMSGDDRAVQPMTSNAKGVHETNKAREQGVRRVARVHTVHTRLADGSRTANTGAA